MKSIEIIDSYKIKFYKPQWTDRELLYAECLDMVWKDGYIIADIRKTWKTSVGGFIRKCFPTLVFRNPTYIKGIFGQLRKMYDADFKSFKERYESRLDYSKSDKELRNYQINVIYRTSHSKSKLLALDMGTGKMENVDSMIITPNGSTRMGDLKIGDTVYGSDGKPCNVTGVFPQGKQDLYRIHLSDGSTAECGLDHLWIVVSNIAAPKDKYRRVMSTKDILDSGLYKSNSSHAKWHIPYCKPVQFPSIKHGPIDPYMLGLLLGDGCFRNTISFSTNDNDLVNAISSLMPFEEVKIKKHKGDNYCYNLSGIGKGNLNPLITEIKNLNLFNCLSHEKFIPKEYLYNDVNTRLSILQGLMDTDGSVSKTGNRITFSTVSPMLAKHVRLLVCSLGGHCTVKLQQRQEKRDSYVLHIIFESGLIPFRLKRHVDKIIEKQRTKRRNIIKIEKLPPVEQQCISVDSYDHSYLTGDFIVTHNTITSATVSRIVGANRTCIIGPSIAKWNWFEDMCHEWGFDETGWTILEPKNRKSMMAIIEKFVVINYEMVGKYLEKFKNRKIDVFILDEVHACKNSTTAKAKNATRLFKMYPKAKRILLSGTPWTNRVTDLYSYLKMCDHPLGKKGKKWFEDEFAIKAGRKIVGVKNEDDLKLMLDNFMIRLKSDDVLELPKLTINKAYFELGALQNDYNDVIKEMDAIKKEYESMSDEDENKKNFKFASKIRQSISSLSRITALSKVPEVVKWVRDLNSQGEKVVIFSSWRSVLEELENQFKECSVRIDGSVAANKRQEIVNRFKKDDDITVFLGQVKAAGVAINLTNARICILMDVPISPDLIEQPIKRLHRGGQKSMVNAYFTFAKGTIDERLYSMIVSKAGDINDIVDSKTKRGVVRYENIPETLFNEITSKHEN